MKYLTSVSGTCIMMAFRSEVSVSLKNSSSALIAITSVVLLSSEHSVKLSFSLKTSKGSYRVKNMIIP